MGFGVRAESSSGKRGHDKSMRTIKEKPRLHQQFDRAKETVHDIDQHHPTTVRYPEVGATFFEKRVDAWMRTNRCLRARFKHGSYVHHNFRSLVGPGR